MDGQGLKDNEALLTDTLNCIQDGISVLDGDFNVLFANLTMQRRYAHQMPIVGKKCHEAYHGRSRPCEVCPGLLTLKTGKQAMEVVPFSGEEGVRGWLELFTFPFVDSKAGRMKGVIEYVRDITERKKAEEQLSISFKDNEVLIKEIHHRVKNNMAMVSSLLRLQSRYIRDKDTAEVLRESQNRIKSMALIHERLFQSKRFSSIDIGGYFRNLAGDLLGSYGFGVEEVKLVIDIEDVHMDIDTLIPCGLIVNELVSNSLRHAFSGAKDPGLRIGLIKEDAGRAVLLVVDNGRGLPGEVDIHGTETLGLLLVGSLVDQLGGNIEVDRAEGTTFKISFKTPGGEG
jgi:PAS domain S-box-containing protein